MKTYNKIQTYNIDREFEKSIDTVIKMYNQGKYLYIQLIPCIVLAEIR